MDTYNLQQGHILWSEDEEVNKQIKRLLNKKIDFNDVLREDSNIAFMPSRIKRGWLFGRK